MADEVEVVIQLAGEDVLAGRLWSHRRRGTESATFAYTTGYLARPDAYELDPALALVEGQQQTRAGQAMFGAFTDCAPDRWGRRLILRDGERRVRREGGTGRSFAEIDYLLGVRSTSAEPKPGSPRFWRFPASSASMAMRHTAFSPR